MTKKLYFLALISLVGTLLFTSPIQLLAQPAPTAIITMGKILVKQGNRRPQEKIPGQRLLPTELISVQRGKKAKIRCLSNRLEWYIPSDGLFRGVREFCP